MLTLQLEKAPVQVNTDGVARIGDTRVTLETIVSAFHRGDSPEQIVDSFDVLSLADVYATIAYYLNHREEVDVYVRERNAVAAQVRSDIEARQPEMFSLRARLLERKRRQS